MLTWRSMPTTSPGGDFVTHPELFQTNTQDFQGAITHEFGHVIGLDHTCFKPRGDFCRRAR